MQIALRHGFFHHLGETKGHVILGIVTPHPPLFQQSAGFPVPFNTQVKKA